MKLHALKARASREGSFFNIVPLDGAHAGQQIPISGHIGTAVVCNALHFQAELGLGGDIKCLPFFHRSPALCPRQQNVKIARQDLHTISVRRTELELSGKHDPQGLLRPVGEQNRAADNLPIEVDIGLFTTVTFLNSDMDSLP